MSEDRAQATKAHLHQCLRWARDEVLPKLDGLDEYVVRRPMTPTGLNLLGLVKHLAFFEASYFGVVFGRPYPEPIPVVDEHFRNPDLMWVPSDQARDDVIADYRKACRHADDTIAALAGDALGQVSWWGPGEVPLYAVLAHMLGETRQHLGHMDIIREQLDGRTGEGVALSELEHSDLARRSRRTEKAARVAGNRFVPAGFVAPTALVGDGFRLEPLGPQHNVRDHAAWMSSIEHIRSTVGYSDGDWPPGDGMTLEENEADLIRHARDFETGRGFTFTVRDPADDDVIGCVYLYPSAREHDVVVQSWVRADRADLDTPLADAVARWIASDWPWSRPDRRGRGHASPWPLRSGALLLRDVGPADIDTLLTFRNRPDVNRLMIRTQVDPEAFRRDRLAVPTSETDFSCVAELAGRVVAIGFLEIEDGMGQPGMPLGTEGMIGYIVDPSFAGRGVGSDLARGLLTAAFERLGLRRVTAGCHADNNPSVRILEKAGMRREQHGVEDSWHAELGWVDGYTYALLDREWRARPGG